MTLYEYQHLQQWAEFNQYHLIGVDEAGRGPLLGPVVAGAVLLPSPNFIQGLACSKALSEKKRDHLFAEICRSSIAWAISEVGAEHIDRINILQASLLAMHQAVTQLIEKANLEPKRCFVLVDGNRLPKWHYAGKAIVKGDTFVPAISAGSILAKVHRDTWCKQEALHIPWFKLESHKGYPTPEHLALLKQYGPTRYHRKSFAPVKALLQQEQAVQGVLL